MVDESWSENKQHNRILQNSLRVLFSNSERPLNRGQLGEINDVMPVVVMSSRFDGI